MGLRQRLWAKKKRLQLRRLLGMKCAHCGSKFYAKLEFDVIVPTGIRHHSEMEWSWRMSFYFQQFRQNNLQLLCGGVGGCHNKKTAKQIAEQEGEAEQPF